MDLNEWMNGTNAVKGKQELMGRSSTHVKLYSFHIRMSPKQNFRERDSSKSY